MPYSTDLLTRVFMHSYMFAGARGISPPTDLPIFLLVFGLSHWVFPFVLLDETERLPLSVNTTVGSLQVNRYLLLLLLLL